MPLPSAVQKIGDAAEAAAEQAGMKTGGKPLQPVETASAVINEPAKVDPSDYKERYSRFKATTDNTIAELRQNIVERDQKLAAQNATISELRTQVAQKTTAQTIPEKSLAGTKEDPAYKTWFDNLSQHLKDEYTEDYLFDQFAIQQSLAPKQEKPAKSNDLSELETRVNNLAQFQEKTKAELYEDEMDTAFPNDEWITLANGPEWSKFCLQTVSAVDGRTYGDIVKQGSESHTAATVTWVLNQFKQHQKSTLEANTDKPVNALAGMVTPEGSGGGGGDPISEINAQAETFTQSQVTQFFNDVATTKKYSAEQAGAIEKQIMAAQTAGKIIQGQSVSMNNHVTTPVDACN